MHKLSYGLYVLTSAHDGSDNGSIINTAGQVTSQPNRISIAVTKDSYTQQLIAQSQRFNVSVLSERATFDIYRHFGFQSGRTADKFKGFSACKRSENGLYYITSGTNAYFSATVEQSVDLGSHMLHIASVDAMDVLSNEPSATYAYYHSQVKPKPEKMGAKGETVWRCDICGHLYEGDSLPDDLICPICKHDTSHFEKITP